MTRGPAPLRVAVVGAGPAGVFTADLLARRDEPVAVDLFERLPVPYGLVRYGVAPDHPRIKAIIGSLHEVLDRRDIRLVAGVDVGKDVPIASLLDAYDAVVLATGADRDAALPIPGADLLGSYGASEFVSFYDAHPDAPTTWPLDHTQVAVVGAGNVALDVARLRARPPHDRPGTPIPAPVAEALASSAVTDVHVFARRGPAEAAFSPLELRELGEIPGIEIVVDPDDLVFDRSSEALIASSRQRKLVADTISRWARDPRPSLPGARRLHLHFMRAPVSIAGGSHVEGLTVERTRHLPNGQVEGTGRYETYPVGQVYRAVGYASSAIPGVAFDADRRRIPHENGRVLDAFGDAVPGLYVSGWIKRGPVGLIGSTKSDSLATVERLMADLTGGARREGDPLERLRESAAMPTSTDWDGWLRVDAHERELGRAEHRERVKVHTRDDLLAIARG